MSADNSNELMPYPQIHSIKVSIKIPVRVELMDIVEECRKKFSQCKIKTYPNFVVISHLTHSSDLWHDKTVFTIFKYSDKKEQQYRSWGMSYAQHVNCAGIRHADAIPLCIDVLASIVSLDPQRLPFTLDNYIATSKLPTPLDKSKFLLANVEHSFENFEVFPALLLKRPSSPVVTLVYGSGSCVYTGASTVEQLIEAQNFITQCFVNYQKITALPMMK